jgi:hypothetical protein
MHSIASVRSSSGAADYFANDNYYTADETRKLGSGAARVRAHSGWRVRSSGMRSRRSSMGSCPTARWSGRSRGAPGSRSHLFDAQVRLDPGAGQRRPADPRCASGGGQIDHVAACREAVRREPQLRAQPQRRTPEDRQSRLCPVRPRHEPRARSAGAYPCRRRQPDPRSQGQLEGTVERRDLEEQHHDRPVLPRRLPRPVAEARLRDRGAGKHGSFEIKGVPARSSRRSASAARHSRPRSRNRAYHRPREDQITRHTRAIPSLRSRIAGAYPILARPRPSWASTASARCRGQGAGRTQAKPTFRETASAAIGEVADPDQCGAAHPEPLAVSGAAALFLSADTIKAQHATASAIRHLSEREAAFSPQAILASALGFQIKGLEGGAVVQRIGELMSATAT